MIRKARILVAASSLAFILIAPQATDAIAQTHPGSALQRRQEMVPMPGANGALARMTPGIHWAKFRTVEIRPLQIPEDVRNAASGSSRTTRLRESYVLRDQDVAKLQELYASAMRDQLPTAGLAITNTPGPDTLILAAHIINIRLAAPVETSRRPNAGRGQTFTQGAGSMTIGGVMADGSTGQVIGEMVDQHNSVAVWGINNSVTNIAEARRGFNNWARVLRDRLVQLRGEVRSAQGPRLR